MRTLRNVRLHSTAGRRKLFYRLTRGSLHIKATPRAARFLTPHAGFSVQPLCLTGGRAAIKIAAPSGRTLLGAAPRREHRSATHAPRATDDIVYSGLLATVLKPAHVRK